MTQQEKIEQNKLIIDVNDLILDDEEEREAFAALNEEQVAKLANGVRFIENKYLHHSAAEVLGAAIKLTKTCGSLDPELLTMMGCALMDESTDWAVVQALTVGDVARKIIGHASGAISDAVELRANSHGDFTEAQKWWDFLNTDGEDALVEALTRCIKENPTFNVVYNSRNYVVFHSPEKLFSIM